jgi:hypothetical protein
VKPDEASNPGHVCLLGAQTVVPKAGLFSKAIEKSWRLGHSLQRTANLMPSAAVAYVGRTRFLPQFGREFLPTWDVLLLSEIARRAQRETATRAGEGEDDPVLTDVKAPRHARPLRASGRDVGCAPGPGPLPPAVSKNLSTANFVSDRAFAG